MTDAEKKLAEIAKIVDGGTIEDVKAVLEDKPKKWVPEVGDTLYILQCDGSIDTDTYLSNVYHKLLLNGNNYFRTVEEATRVRDYRKRHGHKDSILSLMEEAARKDREANPDVKGKCYIVWDRTSKWIAVDPTYILPLPPFATLEAAQDFVNEYEDELEVLKPEGV